MEKENFEDKLKSSFENAEISPSEKVWTNLELELAKAESKVIRQRLLFFKMVAAASVIFALAVAGASIYFLNHQDSARQVSYLSGNSTAEKPSPENSSPETPDPAQTGSPQLQTDDSPAGNISGDRKNNTSVTLSNRETEGVKADEDQKVTEGHHPFESAPGIRSAPFDASTTFTELVLDRNRLTGLIDSKKETEISFIRKEEDPVEKMLARLAEREKQLAYEGKEKKTKKTENNNEKLWTSLGFAAGTFSTVSSGASQPVSATSFSSSIPATDNEATASGQSYTVGVNIGTRVTKRWVVQGGVNYMTQLSDYTAQAVIGTADFQSFRPASTNELEKITDETARSNSRVVTTAPYNVNNNVKYISIPVQAGYLLINKKFGLQLNAGVSTDLFLQNTKTAEGDNIDSIDQGIGDDSPYKPMNFSGLMGTELTYRFGDHYRISFNPGLRYPFSSIYKTNLGIHSTPLAFDLGLRFRYIFQ